MDIGRFPDHLRSGIARLGDDPEFEEIHASLSTPVGDEGFTRRRFLQAAVATGGAAAIGVGPLASVARALEPLGEGDPILIVIQLGGGNDGLNTVIPASDPAYGRLRRATNIASAAIPLGDGGLSLHPALRKLADRYRQRKVAIVRGVGNPDIDRSHFSSMATWMAGTAGTDRSSGWLGRYLDTLPDAAAGLRGVTLDSSVPLHLLGQRSQVSSLGPLGPFGSELEATAEVAMLEALRTMGAGSPQGPLGKAVGAANRLAVDNARTFLPAYAGSTGSSDSSLTAQMQRAARVINANLGTKVLGVTLGSFDTHKDQLWQHNTLLTDFDAAIDGFYRTLAPRWADQVVIMTFSEFGRRAADNGTGTDHGTSAPLLVIGDRVRGGLHGTQPSLTQLDAIGDVAVTVDFRSVYASVLGGWLGADPKPILGGTYPQLSLFASRPTVPARSTKVTDSRFSPYYDVGAFVDKQYEDFLDRKPTKANRDRWIVRLRRGSTSVPAALEEFYRASPYYRQGRQICRVYYCISGRAPTYDQLLRWMAVRQASGLRAVVSEMMATPPVRNRYHRELGSQLVARLHRDMTGMAPSSARTAAWTPRVNRHAENGSIDFIVALATTPEAMRRFAYEANVCCVHAAMLRRAPSASSVSSWTTKLKAGTTIQSMMWSWYRSGEYRTRVV